MLQKPNTVFVAKKFNAAGSSFIAGDVRVIDASTGAVIDLSSSNAISVNEIQLQFKKGDGTVTNSAVIGKKTITSINPNSGSAYIAPVSASSIISFVGATITAGHRYVLRIVYRDIYEHPGQFTHSYEVIAAAGETAITIADKFATLINNHLGARVYGYSSTFTGTPTGATTPVTIGASGAITADITLTANSTKTIAVLISDWNTAHPTEPMALILGDGTQVPTTTSGDITLTSGEVFIYAKSVTDNGFSTQGKEALTLYTQVQMRPVVYTTDPSSRYNSAKAAVTGVTITNIESDPGYGNPYIVRDREQAALGYKGITYRTTFPVIKPELNVDLTKTYDTLVIEFTSQYQSPDNQYVKSTGHCAEVYVEHATSADAETLGDKIRAWMA